MKELEKEFVPYKESLELKELGFNEPCFVRVWWLNSVHHQTKVPFEPHITMNGQDIKFDYPIPEKHPSIGFDALELQIPTFSQAFRWFREKYNLYHSIDPLGYSMCLGKVGELGNLVSCNVPNYGTYEEAELACLRKLIELAKN